MALLVNNTPVARGHYLVVRLRGTASARDAIGASVEARFGDRRIVRQLTAGDGFLASNQRVLLFGLGEHDQVDKLEVRWPSGQISTFDDVAADRELTVVEGRGTPVPMPAPR